MTNLVGSPVNSNNTSSTSFTLANGAGAGRAVLVLAYQLRSPNNMVSSNFLFNGATPTIALGTGQASTFCRVIGVLWRDADLPAAGGAFTIGVNTGVPGVHLVAYELSNADTTSPVIITANLSAGFTTPVVFDFAPTEAGAFLAIAFAQVSDFGSTIVGGTGNDQVTDLATVKFYIGHEKDTDQDQQMSLGGQTNNIGPATYIGVGFNPLATGPDYTQRKGSTFTATHTLGTVPNSATINGLAVTISNATTTTVDVTIDAAITTSAEYNLVIADTVAVTSQTQTVQVNVFGVVPSNNPAQKDGAALVSLTGIQIRITAGANLNGPQVYYSGTETTDASGNFNTLDVSPSAAAAADPVRMQVLTAAGDSITSAETVGLI
jgi:hypothetical protein